MTHVVVFCRCCCCCCLTFAFFCVFFVGKNTGKEGLFFVLMECTSHGVSSFCEQLRCYRERLAALWRNQEVDRQQEPKWRRAPRERAALDCQVCPQMRTYRQKAARKHQAVCKASPIPTEGSCDGDWVVRELVRHIFEGSHGSAVLEEACARGFGFSAKLFVLRVRTKDVPDSLREGLRKTHVLQNQSRHGAEQFVEKMAGPRKLLNWPRVIAVLAACLSLDYQEHMLQNAQYALVRWLTSVLTTQQLTSPAQLKELHVLIEPAYKSLLSFLQ